MENRKNNNENFELKNGSIEIELVTKKRDKFVITFYQLLGEYI